MKMKNEWLEQIESALKEAAAVPDMPYKQTAEAMAYSLEAGGKRLRPMLALEFCRLAGGEPEKAMPFACAVEMIHTYSLIHDDLPCMDNDDMRRGKPSCHKAFGEATALLAGDALLTKAFEMLSKAELPPERIVKAAAILSRCAGIDGMIGGQAVDLLNEAQAPDFDTLELTCRLKTAALLQAACLLGIAAAGNDQMADKAREYGLNLGLAFQIVDDILDVTGDSALLGKPVGSDAENGKTTFVTLCGLEKARELAEKYSRGAVEVLAQIPGSEDLSRLTEQLLLRKH